MRLGGAIVRQDLRVQDSKRVRQRDGAGLRVAYGLVALIGRPASAREKTAASVKGLRRGS